ncbi:MAG: hypothetical protein IIZ90_04925 [Bacteroidales bacterium]|nr:hypothetical protein [Bacteroidales bacterium]
MRRASSGRVEASKTSFLSYHFSLALLKAAQSSSLSRASILKVKVVLPSLILGDIHSDLSAFAASGLVPGYTYR